VDKAHPSAVEKAEQNPQKFIDDHIKVLKPGVAPAEQQESPSGPAQIDIPSLSNSFLQDIQKGTKGINKLTIKKRVAEILGVKPSELTKEKGYSHKPVEEAYEYAIVKYARGIIDNGGTDEQVFQALKKVYENQPNLATRTSASMENQAYSTPVHLAYLTQRFAGVNKDTWNYEPTAGTGMLVSAGNPAKTVANEIGEDRLAILNDHSTGHDLWVLIIDEIASLTDTPRLIVPNRNFHHKRSFCFYCHFSVRVSHYTVSELCCIRTKQ
jgi:hypothetical protein